MNKAEVIEHCRAMQAAKDEYDNLGMMNRPTEAEARVDIDAKITVSRDKWLGLVGNYDRALKAWAAGGYQE